MPPKQSKQLKKSNEINKISMSETMLSNIETRCEELTIKNFNPEKEYINMFKFVTKNSNDIKLPLLKYAVKILNRSDSINKLRHFVKNEFVATDIEKGIFEFALVNVVINKFQHILVENIYLDKLSDICDNLDITNCHIDNKTLLPLVTNGSFRPFFVAFLSPDQMHPKRWSATVDKQKAKDDAINNISTTDIYRCGKCGERKMKISRLQLRSADEPENLFLVCLVCFHTFIK
jgi:predicted metal-binding protein